LIDFTEDQLRRYARHIILPEVGGVGQERLLNAKVLVVGAGGLGSPVLMYLAAAGVGHIGVVDDDVVDLSNLQRQIVHATESVGQLKVESAYSTLQAINPGIEVIRHACRITPENALALIDGYDIVADGSDNFATRFLINDACYFAKKTLVSAAILRFDGQLASFKPHLGGPCYRCLYREPPPVGMVPTCSAAGVLGAIAGVMGSLQAAEILKEILGVGESMAGHLLIHDSLSMSFRKVRVRPDPGCPLCGPSPSIKDLSGHDTAARDCA
jgi:molybdopterin/thiamine biosynthesis adenylyltransferase